MKGELKSYQVLFSDDKRTKVIEPCCFLEKQ